MEFRGIKARDKQRYDKVSVVGTIHDLTDQPIIAIHVIDAAENTSSMAYIDLATAKKIGEHLIELAGEEK